MSMLTHTYTQPYVTEYIIIILNKLLSVGPVKASKMNFILLSCISFCFFCVDKISEVSFPLSEELLSTFLARQISVSNKFSQLFVSLRVFFFLFEG